MKKILQTVIFLLFITSCVTTGLQIEPNCVPRALYQGSTWKYQHKADIQFVVKNISEGTDHIQNQFKASGSNIWEWSSQTDGYVHYGSEEFIGAKVIKIIDWNEFLKERIEANK